MFWLIYTTSSSIFVMADKIAPLRTMQSLVQKNISSHAQLSKQEIVNMFMAPQNVNFICNSFIGIRKQFGYQYDKSQFNDFCKQIIQKMYDWTQTHNLNEYELLESDVTTDFDILMNFINKQFIIYNYNVLGKKQSDLEHTKPDYHINNYDTNSMTTCGANINVSGKNIEARDLYAADYANIDIWKPIEQYRSDKNFRDWNGRSNAIPIWQDTGSQRHYDRSNDGFYTEKFRASLNNPVCRKYDMTDIYNKIGNQKTKHQTL